MLCQTSYLQCAQAMSPEWISQEPRNYRNLFRMKVFNIVESSVLDKRLNLTRVNAEAPRADDAGKT